MKAIAIKTWRFAILPFVFMWRFLVVVWRGMLAISVFALLLFIAIEFVSYQRDSHRHSASGNCSAVEQKLATFGASMGRSFRCLNLTLATAPLTHPQGMIFFLASSARPSMSDTGHGWVVYAKASIDDHGLLLIHEFKPVGFSPADRNSKWPPQAQRIYASYIASRLPSSIEASLSKLLGVTWLPLNQNEESPLQFSETRPMDEGAILSPQFRSIFGNNPDVALVALLSDNEYVNAKKIVSDFAVGDYSVLLRDCTTFVERVAKTSGLYVPPRIFYPFPSDFISAMSLMNRM